MAFIRTRCPACKKKLSAGQKIHAECIDAYAEMVQKKADRARAKATALHRKTERESIKQRKEALKSRADWLAEAKKLLQKRRRLEELKKGSGCISCGRSQDEVQGTDGWKIGGAWDGGHFMSKGARPELALEPLNIWLQCKSCNAGSGKYARKGYTVSQNFERNLATQHGKSLVDWLKGPHEAKHYTIDQLIEICKAERERINQLKE